MNTIPLNTMAFITGGSFVALSLPALFMPDASRSGLCAFARNARAAWLLTGVDLVWVAWIVLHASFGTYENLKPFVYFIAPFFFYMLITYLDELLAARSLGGLLLLAANPVLYSSRWHDSPWRLVMPSLAYALVIVGMTLVLSPYRFRDWTTRYLTTPAKCRLLGLAAFILGGTVIALGTWAY